MKNLFNSIIFSIGSVLLLPIVLSHVADSAVRVYPGPAPCNQTLQACINAAATGDVVQTAAFFIDEDVLINKSLTLMPYPGYSAVAIGGGSTPRFIGIVDNPQNQAIKVTIDQLLLSPGAISISLNQGSGHEVTIRNSFIDAYLGSTATRGITTDIRTSASIKLEQNLIQSDGYPMEFRSTGKETDAIYFSAIGNRVTGTGSSISATGIQLDHRGAGFVESKILSNVIWNVASCNCGGASGMHVINGTQGDTLHANIRIANNTIDNAGGIGVFYSQSAPTASQNSYFYNNIVTNSSSGIYLPAYSQSQSIQHNYNNFFGNTGGNNYGGYPPGPQTFSFNPLNDDQGYGYYALQSTSPAINAGNTAVDGAISYFDAAGHPRLISSTIDLGAYESSYAQGTEYMLLEYYFGLEPPSDFLYQKGTWLADGTNLFGFSNRKASFLTTPALTACSVCQFESTFKTAGDLFPGTLSKIWALAWYSNKSNLIEVIIKEGQDKIILRQKVNGAVVRKTKADAVIHPYTEYRFKVAYDGANISVFLNDEKIITMPAQGTPSGTFGFQSKATRLYLNDLFVHY